MFTDVQDALHNLFEAQRATGKHLENVDLVSDGDREPGAQFAKVVTLDWDGKIHFVASGNALAPMAIFAIGAISTGQSENDAERQVADMLARWEDGKLKGLLAVLACVRGIRGASGQGYSLAILPQVARGKLSEPGRMLRMGAYFFVEVKPKPLTMDDFAPL